MRNTPEPDWDRPDPLDAGYASEKCPDCGQQLSKLLPEERVCGLCGYHRTPPPPGAATVGIIGKADYPTVRDRLIIVTLTLYVGKVIATHQGQGLAEGLGNELAANFTTVTHFEQLIDQSTHVLFMSYAEPLLRHRVEQLGKRHWLIDGRMWPKRKPGEPYYMGR